MGNEITAAPPRDQHKGRAGRIFCPAEVPLAPPIGWPSNQSGRRVRRVCKFQSQRLPHAGRGEGGDSAPQAESFAALPVLRRHPVLAERREGDVVAVVEGESLRAAQRGAA